MAFPRISETNKYLDPIKQYYYNVISDKIAALMVSRGPFLRDGQTIMFNAHYALNAPSSAWTYWQMLAEDIEAELESEKYGYSVSISFDCKYMWICYPKAVKHGSDTERSSQLAGYVQPMESRARIRTPFSW